MNTKYQQVLLEEYKEQKKDPVIVKIGTQEFIVPASYNNNVDNFVDDLLSFQDNNLNEFNKYNEKHPENPINPVEMKCGKYYLLPPLRYVKNGMNSKQMRDRMIATALRLYQAAIKNTLKVRKEYPDYKFSITLDPQKLKNLDKLHKSYCLNNIYKACKIGGNKMLNVTKFTAKHMLQMVTGTAFIAPALVYQFTNKKMNICRSNLSKTLGKNTTNTIYDIKNNIDKKVIPYINKGAIKSFIVAASIFATAKINGNNKSDANLSQDSAIEQKVENMPQEENISLADLYNNLKPTPQLQTSSAQRYNITNKETFKKMFDESFPLIIGTLIPTEIFVDHPYSDNGAPDDNTIGIGSYWYPANGNPDSPTWITTKNYYKTHNKKSISGKHAYDLVKGWFCTREGGRVYNSLYNNLKGTQLTANEFAAIASVTYNSEECGFTLCKTVAKNWQNPVVCAAKIMELQPSNQSFSNGILVRHTHEALTYLNYDNNYICNIPYMQIKEGVNSKGKTYYTSSVCQLSPQLCASMKTELATGIIGEATNKVFNKIINYSCKGGKTIEKICKNSGMGDIGKDILDVSNSASANARMRLAETHSKHGTSIYNNALKDYKNGKYAEALAGFQQMLKEGYDGADIHNDMAITYYHLKQYDKCIEECHKVLATGEDAEYPKANFNAGLASIKMGKNSEALAYYKAALEANPDNKAYQNAYKKLENTIVSGKDSSTKPSSDRLHS